MILTVGYSDGYFTIKPDGNLIIREISGWVGWKRLPTGTYRARAWVSSVLGMGKLVAHSLTWTPQAAAIRDTLFRDLSNAKEALAGGVLPLNATYPTERRPRPYQTWAMTALQSMGYRAILADEMGLGKTSTALWAVDNSKLTRLLVVCPASVKFNWQSEILETLSDSWSTVVIDGSATNRADQITLVRDCLERGVNTAVVINYDLLRWLKEDQMDLVKRFVENNFLIIDESHYVKEKDSERSIICKELSLAASAVIALTGTPIRDIVEDMWHQAEVVRPGVWTSHTEFCDRYLVIKSIDFTPAEKVRRKKRVVRKVVGTKNIDELNAVTQTFMIRRLKSEVGGLPPKIRTYPQLELDTVTLRIYKAMKEFARVEIEALLSKTEDKARSIWHPEAKSAVEQAMRCEQIAQGFIGGIPEPLMHKFSGDILQHAEKIEGRPGELVFPVATKIRWLRESIETILAQKGAPLVFSRFNAPLFWLRQKLAEEGVKVAMMHGGIPAEQRLEFTKGFNEGRYDVLLSQVRIAEGWNAQRSQDVLFLGRDWSPAINWQAEDRAHRIGQKGTVNVQIPVVRKTIETLIHKRLEAKDSDAQQALKTITLEELMESL